MQSSDNRLKIMIVDDDPLIRELMQFNLEKTVSVRTHIEISVLHIIPTNRLLNVYHRRNDGKQTRNGFSEIS